MELEFDAFEIIIQEENERTQEVSPLATCLYSNNHCRSNRRSRKRKRKMKKSQSLTEQEKSMKIPKAK